MTTKLTLTIEQEVIQSAKTFARKKGKSLSELIENYLMTLVSKEKKKEDISPRVKRLVGAIKLPKDFDHKKSYADEISKKYGK